MFNVIGRESHKYTFLCPRRFDRYLHQHFGIFVKDMLFLNINVSINISINTIPFMITVLLAAQHESFIKNRFTLKMMLQLSGRRDNNEQRWPEENPL